MDKIGADISAIVAAIVGVAVVALIVSPNARSAGVLEAAFSGLSNLIGVAVSPVTGQQVSGLSGAGLSGGGWSAYTVPAAAGPGGSLTVAGQNGMVSIGNIGGLLTGAGNLATSIGGLFSGSGSGGGATAIDNVDIAGNIIGG
jgi:hypothetical protein